MAKEIIVRTVDIQTDQAVQNLEKVDGAIDEVDKSSEEMTASMNAMPGPLGKVASGFKALGATLKALLTNPVVLFLVATAAAVTALGKAFLFTQSGADAMGASLDGARASLDEFKRSAGAAVNALSMAKVLGFRTAIELSKHEMAGMRDRMDEARVIGTELFRLNQQILEEEAKLLPITAKRRTEIMQLRIDSRDMALSTAEQTAAIRAASEIESQILADEQALARLRVEAAEKNLALAAGTVDEREADLELSRAIVAEEQLKTRELSQQRRYVMELNVLEVQAEAQRKAAADAREKERAEAEKLEAEKRKAESDMRKEEAEIEREFEEEMAKERSETVAFYDAEAKKQDDASTNQMIANAERRFKYEEDLMAKQLADEQLLAQTKNNIYQDSLSALIGFMGEGSKIGKGIQIAEATRSAIQGAINAYTATVLRFPVLAPIAAAASLAAGMANVRKIASTPDPLGGGGGSVPSVSLARPSSGLDSSDFSNPNQGIASDVNILQDRTTRGAQEAYVVQSKVTAAQDVERQRKSQSTL